MILILFYVHGDHSLGANFRREMACVDQSKKHSGKNNQNLRKNIKYTKMIQTDE